jgi:hypothetical protein
MLVSGAEDGFIKIWDMHQFKISSSFKVGTRESSFPISLAIKADRAGSLAGVVVGLYNKTVKYFSVDSNDSNNPANWKFIMACKTTIESYHPLKMKFFN